MYATDTARSVSCPTGAPCESQTGFFKSDEKNTKLCPSSATT